MFVSTYLLLEKEKIIKILYVDYNLNILFILI